MSAADEFTPERIAELRTEDWAVEFDCADFNEDKETLLDAIEELKKENEKLRRGTRTAFRPLPPFDYLGEKPK